VRIAQRLGVMSCIATTRGELSDFYKLCIDISQDKNFHFQYSKDFLQYLFDHNSKNGTEAKLFLAKIEDEIAAGAFILRTGKNCHYMFGSVNRQYAKQRVGEFVQWSVIEWACQQGCSLYDLEGIDEIKNPGVTSFKKKMGGQEITLKNTHVYSFSYIAKILSKCILKKIS